jgi:hypothetical protein
MRSRAHAVARIVDRQHDARSATAFGMFSLAGEGDTARLDRDLAAVRHRIARVDREIHQDLI